MVLVLHFGLLMNAKTVGLQATKRTEKAGSARRAGQVPAILYGHGLKNENIQVDAKLFLKVLAEAGRTSLVDLSVDGKEHNVLIREVQLHPMRDEVLHADFYQVRMDEEVRADVPLEYVGESPAVKDLGGVLVRNFDTLEIEALPKDLPRSIEVDISKLGTFEAVIKVADLTVGNGVKVLVETDAVVALVQPPRSDAELESLSEEVKEDVESVEGVVKPEVPAEGEEGSEADTAGEEEKKAE